MNIGQIYNLGNSSYNLKANNQKQENPAFGNKMATVVTPFSVASSAIATTVLGVMKAKADENNNEKSQYIDTVEENDFNHKYIVREYTSGPLKGHRQTLELNGALVKQFCPDGRILTNRNNNLHIRFKDKTVINIKGGDITTYLNTEGKNQTTAQDVVDARYTKERQEELMKYISKTFTDTLYNVEGVSGYYEILEALEEADRLHP